MPRRTTTAVALAALTVLLGATVPRPPAGRIPMSEQRTNLLTLLAPSRHDRSQNFHNHGS
ncbi:hypothetical protein FBY35_5827 [Streptomyces sp. SLBN-118]|nr:hypothetical protein FBY35_5827 [Streptomyces sp. SLBN-118]